MSLLLFVNQVRDLIIECWSQEMMRDCPGTGARRADQLLQVRISSKRRDKGHHVGAAGAQEGGAAERCRGG